VSSQYGRGGGEGLRAPRGPAPPFHQRAVPPAPAPGAEPRAVRRYLLVNGGPTGAEVKKEPKRGLKASRARARPCPSAVSFPGGSRVCLSSRPRHGLYAGLFRDHACVLLHFVRSSTRRVSSRLVFSYTSCVLQHAVSPLALCSLNAPTGPQAIETAAESGFVRAQYYLGMMFLNGHGGVTASTEKAVRPAPRAASRGDCTLRGEAEAERERLYTSLAPPPRSRCCAPHCSRRSNRVRSARPPVLVRDPVAAVRPPPLSTTLRRQTEWLQKAAVAGDGIAAWELSQLMLKVPPPLRRGRYGRYGGATDIRERDRWARLRCTGAARLQARREGAPHARRWLAQGKGMEKEGTEWLRKAAAAGVQEAKAALAKA